MAIRKLMIFVEEVYAEGGQPVSPPTRMAAVAAVISNPFAGRYVADLKPLVNEYSEQLGKLLAERALAALGVEPGMVQGFGKGALVGTDGEIEHGSAIIHTLRFGDAFRRVLGGAKSLLPSVEKRGAPGASMDVPVKHREDSTIRSHHQTFEVRIPDAPRADEIVVVGVLAIASRPHARSGDLKDELKTANSAP